MAPLRLPSDAVHMFMNDLAIRLVLESGIKGDRYHVGKLILQSLRDAPDFVAQIDGATGESELNSSVLKRSIQCALSMKKLGLQIGDVIGVTGPNNLDLTIPLYASTFLGMPMCAIDANLAVDELTDNFNISKPKVIFCQNEKAVQVENALKNAGLNSHIITFDKGNHLSFAEFLSRSDDTKLIDEFKATDFDTAVTGMVLMATSGTTGVPKCAEITHKSFIISNAYLWTRFDTFPTPTKMALVGSQMQWLSGIISYIMSIVLRFTRLQSSSVLTTEHAQSLINTYRPTYTLLSPNLMSTLIKQDVRDGCDYTCFEAIMLGGGAVHESLIKDIKEISPNTAVYTVYGMTEVAGTTFHCNSVPLNSAGLPIGCSSYRLVDLNTMTDIMEPHVKGELWIKGPTVFKGYYNNPEVTKEAFGEGNWFRTGDLFYRDEYYYFYFCERIKRLLKYRNHQISPLEIESVISAHPDVREVVVVGVPVLEHGELPAAAVVKNKGSTITAQEIEQLVKDKLSEFKQLRGGVVFFEKFPTTASSKNDIRKIAELVKELKKQY